MSKRWSTKKKAIRNLLIAAQMRGDDESVERYKKMMIEEDK